MSTAAGTASSLPNTCFVVAITGFASGCTADDSYSSGAEVGSSMVSFAPLPVSPGVSILWSVVWAGLYWSIASVPAVVSAGTAGCSSVINVRVPSVSISAVSLGTVLANASTLLSAKCYPFDCTGSTIVAHIIVTVAVSIIVGASIALTLEVIGSRCTGSVTRVVSVSSVTGFRTGSVGYDYLDVVFCAGFVAWPVDAVCIWSGRVTVAPPGT